MATAAAAATAARRHRAHRRAAALLTGACEARGPHRVGPADEAVEQDAEAVDVAALGRRLSCQHFRRHVKRGPCPVVARAPFLERPSRAEVHHEHAAAALADDVARLDVAVQQASRVHGRQGAGQLDAGQQRFFDAEAPVAFDHLVERVAGDQLHPHAGHAIMRVRAVNRDDVRVAEAGEEAAFLQRVGVGGRIVAREQLEGDLARQVRIPGPVHRAARAASDLAADFEIAPARRRPGGVVGLLAENREAGRTGNRLDDPKRIERGWRAIGFGAGLVQPAAVEQGLQRRLEAEVRRHWHP